MKPKVVLWASFFVNAFSFVFTLRPKNAMILITAFLVVGISGYYFLGKEILSPITEVFLVVVFLFLPVVMNGVFLLIHEANLRHSSTSEKMKMADLLGNISDLVS